MAGQTDPGDMSTRRVVVELPGMREVPIRCGVQYAVGDLGALEMDIYYPPGVGNGACTPMVLFVTGYSDPGFEKMVGCKLKDMGAYVSWAQLAAASGMVAITYSNENPERDLYAALSYIRKNASSLSIDANRIGIWSCSGNVPNALSLMMSSKIDLKCAVLCYGYMLDDPGVADVTQASDNFGFVNPNHGKSLSDLSPTMPMFVIRAGQDKMPNLNASIDRFVRGALAENLPITLVNHATAPHAFELSDHSERTKAIINDILSFLKLHLAG